MANASEIPAPPGFDDLPKEEKIRYLQALWDQIVDAPGDLPVPESHLAVLEQRLAEHRRDPGRARSAYEILDQLANRKR
jgi:putative addiction module component (TIGR02574 family)